MRNINALKDDADPALVAECIGIKSAKRGKHMFILCPSHNDHNIGSCYLTAHGYTCRACGAHGDVIKMVQDFKKCSFPEACDIVADICGGKEKYYLSSDEAKTVRDNANLLRRNECSTIDIDVHAIEEIVNCTKSRTEAREIVDSNIGYFIEEDFDENGEELLLIKRRLVGNPLSELYNEDEQQYRCLISEHCDVTIEKYRNFAKKLSDIKLWDKEFLQTIGYVTKNIPVKMLLRGCNKAIDNVLQIKATVIDVTEQVHSKVTKIADAVWEQKREAPF